MSAGTTERSRWELSAESVVVKLRWFGVVMGYVLVQTRTGLHDPWAVRAFLALGAGYAALDLAFWRMGEVFLKRWPLCVSLLESVFIALLCYHDTGLSSPFRWYYLLSLICCSIRYSAAVAWWSVAFHSVSLLVLARVLGATSVWDSSVPLTLLDHGLGHVGVFITGRLSARRGARARAFEFRAGDRARRPGTAGGRSDRGAAGIAGAGDSPGENGGVRPAGRGNRA